MRLFVGKKRGTDDWSPSNDKIATDKLNRSGLIDPGPPLIFERSALVEVPLEWGLANLAVVATVAMTRRNRCTTVEWNPFSLTFSLSPWKGGQESRNPLVPQLVPSLSSSCNRAENAAFPLRNNRPRLPFSFRNFEKFQTYIDITITIFPITGEGTNNTRRNSSFFPSLHFIINWNLIRTDISARWFHCKWN